MEKKTWLLESKKQTEVSFKEVPLLLRLKILFGGKIWIASKAQITLEKTDVQPTAISDGIELYITKKPK